MKLSEKSKNIIILPEGGVGKTLMCTPMIRGLHKKYPDKKIITISPHSEVFDGNPNIHRNFKLGDNKYLYEDYIKGNSIINCDPYTLDSFRLEGVHLSTAWCDEVEVECDSTRPDLFISAQERGVASSLLGDIYSANPGKPIIFVQYSGGNSVRQLTPDGKVIVNYNILRNANKVISEIVDKLSEDFTFISMKQPEEEPAISDKLLALKDYYHYRVYAALMEKCVGYFGIDSLGVHMASALKKPGVVLWGSTSSKSFGYLNHTNFSGTCPLDDSGCRKGIGKDLNVQPCSKDGECMTSFNVESIEKAVRKMATPIETKENSDKEKKE